MTDELSTHMHISVLVFFTAAYLAVVVNLLVMGLSIYRGYGNKVSDQIVLSQNTVIIDIQGAGVVSAPQAYSALNQSLDTIEKVIYSKNGVNTTIYNYSDLSEQGLLRLMTEHRTDMVRVTVARSTAKPNMIVVTVTEVAR